jgi:hydrogenase nickel incorporation protein HypA/HybF
MHELSIAYQLVEIAANAAQTAGASRVAVVRLRLGALSGVVKDALLFSYDIATADTLLEGSRLEIEEVPLAIYCPTCDQIRTLDTIQSLRCPVCDQPSGNIRQGRELEIISIEISDEMIEDTSQMEDNDERQQPAYS